MTDINAQDYLEDVIVLIVEEPTPANASCDADILNWKGWKYVDLSKDDEKPPPYPIKSNEKEDISIRACQLIQAKINDFGNACAE